VGLGGLPRPGEGLPGGTRARPKTLRGHEPEAEASALPGPYLPYEPPSPGRPGATGVGHFGEGEVWVACPPVRFSLDEVYEGVL